MMLLINAKMWPEFDSFAADRLVLYLGNILDDEDLVKNAIERLHAQSVLALSSLPGSSLKKHSTYARPTVSHQYVFTTHSWWYCFPLIRETPIEWPKICTHV
jgi:hypothetical protein